MSLIDEINQIRSRLDDAEPPSNAELRLNILQLAKIAKRTIENVDSSLTHFDIQVAQLKDRLKKLEPE